MALSQRNQRMFLATLSAIMVLLGVQPSAASYRESVHTTPPRSEVDKHEKVDLMQKVLLALQKGIDFFAEDYSAINVDGIFGMRLAEGSVSSMLKECQNDQLECPEDLVSILQHLQNKIDHTVDMAMPYLDAQDPLYLKNFRAAVEKKYVLDYRPEYLGTGKLVEPSGLKYDEDRGDVCFNLILGTGQLNNRDQPKCTITEDCWRYMTKPDMNEYFITHQLLYFIFIDKSDCEAEAQATAKAKDSYFLRDVERRFCRNILGETRELFQDGDVSMMNQDLFLEQSVLCGMLGFEDFFADEFILATLSWQRPSGCYTLAPKILEKAMKVEKQREMRSKLLEVLKEEAKEINEYQPATRRKLLREVQMEGGCLSHKTGLAIGTLGAYLRFLVEHLYSSDNTQRSVV